MLSHPCANYAIPITACFAVGLTTARIQKESIRNWYPTLKKSSLSPPNVAFPVAWSILYCMIGASAGYLLTSEPVNKDYLLKLWLGQFVFNASWSVVFFVKQMPPLALANILVLDGLVLEYILKSWDTCRTSSWLFIPYMAWISFATYLNGYIVKNN